MSFLDGFLGLKSHRRSTPQAIVEREHDRIYSRKVRRQLEEEEELVKCQSFLCRKFYSEDDMARPNNLDEYMGQSDVKGLIDIFIRAAKVKKVPLPHCLFSGEAGLGKTTLSYIIAKELQANFILTNGEQLRSEKELFNIFKQFKDDKLNILFIDEVHTIKIPETLYPVMENFCFGYTTATNEVINLPLPPFTLIGATTDPSKLPKALLQRFLNRFRLVSYTVEELSQIIRNYLNRIKYYPTTEKTLREIALRSRNIARYAINYTKNLLDFCLVEHLQLNPMAVERYFDKEKIDKEGLTHYDRQYLKLLFNSKNLRAGLNTIVKSLGVDKMTVEREIEAYLLRKKYITVGTGGREITEKGFEEGVE